MLFRILVMSVAMLLPISQPTLAQDREATPRSEKCRATPQAESQDQRQKNKDTRQQNQQPLAETLALCDGVLKPPSVGDQEMSRPAPRTGEIPEVKPRDLPGQQPSPESK
jgi:hypothetical protein